MLSSKGAYRLKSSDAERKVILIATGSEVQVAMDVAAALEEKGVGADVVSMPCMERFEEQPQAYKDDLLPNVSPDEILRVSIEAGATLGWERYTMTNGLTIGIDRFWRFRSGRRTVRAFRLYQRGHRSPDTQEDWQVIHIG